MDLSTWEEVTEEVVVMRDVELDDASVGPRRKFPILLAGGGPHRSHEPASCLLETDLRRADTGHIYLVAVG